MSEERILEILCDHANALEATAVNLKRQVAEVIGALPGAKPAPPAVKEETFTCLKFEAQKTEKLGDFETADEKNNLPQNWTSAFNILKQNNSTIKSRYHGPGYAFSYWIWNGRIFKQRLKSGKT